MYIEIYAFKLKNYLRPGCFSIRTVRYCLTQNTQGKYISTNFVNNAPCFVNSAPCFSKLR